MFLTTANYVIMGIGVLALLFWLFLYFRSGQYDQILEGLSENEYPFHESYGVGLAFLDLMHYNYRGNGDRKLRQILGILYLEKYTEYYLRIVRAQQITFALTLVVMAFIFYGLANDVLMLVLFFGFAGLAYYYFGVEPKTRIGKRSEEMLADFSEVVSNLALLTNAGMVLKEAWSQVAFSSNTVLYLEMQRVVDDMNNGIAETDAIYRFGLRCIIPEIKKFSSTIVQGLVKGNSELAISLQEQSTEVWNLKKQNARRAGEKAASKLLLPIFMMFGGVLVMIIIPIFANMMG